MARARKTGVSLGRPAAGGTRLKTALTSCAEVAKEAYDAASTLGFFEDDAPWALFAHSMGCWSSYEFALLARSNGKRPPSIMVASGFPSPSLPIEERPWTPSRDLNDADFREECRKWRINDVVFGSQMRAYEPARPTSAASTSTLLGDAAPLSFPVKGVYGTQDDRCTLK